MRKYIIHYYVEINDECVDRELILEAVDFDDSVIRFKVKVRVYKRIFKVEELCHTKE